jgi:hypothetical protein
VLSKFAEHCSSSANSEINKKRVNSIVVLLLPPSPGRRSTQPLQPSREGSCVRPKPSNFPYISIMAVASITLKGKSDSKGSYPSWQTRPWTAKDRYLWIDLAAEPVDYGPALSGDGVLPRGEFHPLAALHGRPTPRRTASFFSLFLFPCPSLSRTVAVAHPLHAPLLFSASWVWNGFVLFGVLDDFWLFLG